MPRQYPKDFRDRAVRLVTESKEDYETEWAAIQVVASRLNVGAETLRKWMRRSEIDAGVRPGVSSADQAEIRRLKKEVSELRRANEILRTASAFFASGASTVPRRDDPICGCIS
jgi:transposase